MTHIQKLALTAAMLLSIHFFSSCTKEELTNNEYPVEQPSEEENISEDNDKETHPLPIVGNVELDKLYGYATSGTGTNGGQGATQANIHHFNDGAKFQAWLNSREKNKSEVPAIVWLSGKFTKDQGRGSGTPWFDIKRTKNISIYGTDDFVMENIGLFLREAQNIIIRNVYIKLPKADNGADGIAMEQSNNVWVDHCTFESVNQSSDYEDGSCDITHGTYNVTLSWNRFIKTQKTCLIGHSDSNGSVDEKITVTLHHNFFDLSSSRHPRVRFGRAHVYNNFYNRVSTYGAGSAMNARVLLESNYFNGVHLPTDICTFPAKKSGSSWISNLTGSKAGFLFATTDNVYENKPVNASAPHPFQNVGYEVYQGKKLEKDLQYSDFVPDYNYIVDPADKINVIVPTGAGVGKLPGYTIAPIAVDNGGAGLIPPTEEPESHPQLPEEITQGGWASLNFGSASGKHISNGGSIDITAKGKFENSREEFYFVYKELVGDFVMTVRLDNYTAVSTTNQAAAGLFLSSLGSDFVFAFSAKGGNGYNYSHRLAAGGNASRGSLYATDGEGSVYLKLERSGNTYKASYSSDGGITYGKERTGTFSGSLGTKVLAGLAVNSGDNNKVANARFSDMKINGQTVSF